MRSIVYAAEQSGDRGKRKAFRRTDVLSVPAKSTCPGFFVATSTHSQCCVTHTHTFPSSFNSNERVQTADLERGVCVPLEKSYFFTLTCLYVCRLLCLLFGKLRDSACFELVTLKELAFWKYVLYKKDVLSPRREIYNSKNTENSWTLFIN